MSISSQNQAVFAAGGMGTGYVDPNSLAPIGQRTYAPRPSAAAAAAGSGVARVTDARKQMYDLAKKRLSDQESDPVDAMIRQQLQNRVSGTDMPYNETTTNALMTQQSEMAAAAEKSQMGRIRGNPNDPSFRAQQAEIMANRQGALQSARLGINSQAGLANYNARGTAIGQLGNWNSGYQQRLTGASNYLGGLYGNESATTGGSGGAAGGGGNFTQAILPGGRGQGAGGALSDAQKGGADPFAGMGYQYGPTPQMTTGNALSPARQQQQAMNMAEYEARLRPQPGNVDTPYQRSQAFTGRKFGFG